MILENLEPDDSEQKGGALSPAHIAHIYLQLLWPDHADNNLLAVLQTPADKNASQK